MRLGDRLQIWQKGKTPGASRHRGFGTVIAVSEMGFCERRHDKRGQQNTFLIQLENGEILDSLHCDVIPQGKAFEIAKRIEDDISWIRLSLKFPESSERRLTAYIEKEFGCNLETKLYLILQEWIGKSLGYLSIRENHS